MPAYCSAPPADALGGASTLLGRRTSDFSSGIACTVCFSISPTLPHMRFLFAQHQVCSSGDILPMTHRKPLVTVVVELEELVEDELVDDVMVVDVPVEVEVEDVLLVWVEVVLVDDLVVVVDVLWKHPRPRAAQHQAFFRMSQRSTHGKSTSQSKGNVVVLIVVVVGSAGVVSVTALKRQRSQLGHVSNT